MCLSGSCVPGNCTSSADCTSGGSPTCGFSTPNFCGGCTDDSQCPSADICVTAAFDAGVVHGTCVPKNQGGCVGSGASTCPANPADECCGGSCSVGGCCVGLTPNGCNGAVTTCAPETSGQTSGPGLCTTCAAVTGANPIYYVDPVNGSDATGTGNITSAAGCAFQTVRRALQVIGSSAVLNTTIDVIGGTVDAGAPLVIQGAAGGTPPAGQEHFPITLGTNITLTASGGPIVFQVPATSVGFVLSGALAAIVSGSGGASITVDGQSQAANAGIAATSPSGTITSVKIQNFKNEGILVATSGSAAASLTIGKGVTVSGNGGDGLLVQSGTATLNNTTGTLNLADTFSGNGAHGIRVAGAGVLNLAGTPGANPPNTSTVIVTNNTTAGIWIENPTATTQSVISGVVSTLSSGGNGMRIIPGSNVKVRGSWLLHNTVNGIDVENNTGGTSTAIANIDLGTGTAGGDAGGNTLQDVSSGKPNGGAGLCLRLPTLLASVTLKARGNTFQNGAVCTSTGPGGTLVTNVAKTCTGGVDVGGTIAATDAGAGNKIDVTTCVYP